MYSIGEQIIYGTVGVCTIIDIRVPDVSGARMSYVLRPHYMQNSTVYAPVEGNPVRMRALLSRAEVQSLIDSLPDMPPFAAGKEKQELYDTCRNAIKSTDSTTIARLLKTLYQKKLMLAEQRKIVPSTERDFFETAEKVLYGEFATALEIPLEDVGDYIAGRIGHGHLQTLVS